MPRQFGRLFLGSHIAFGSKGIRIYAEGISHAHKLYWDAEKALCFKDRDLKIEDTEANQFLTREYRKGYELPKV